MKSQNRSTGKKRWLYTAGVCFAVLLACGLWYYHFAVTNCRFTEVTTGQVYRSGAMPSETLERIVKQYKIKTVIDFRKPGSDDPLNPGTTDEIDTEHEVLSRLGINHFNIPSEQVPADKTVMAFLKVMDNKDHKPILMHCYHGQGRAVLFSAIYRMEYEGWKNERARCASRFITHGSSVSKTSGKGQFVSNYKVSRNK